MYEEMKDPSASGKLPNGRLTGPLSNGHRPANTPPQVGKQGYNPPANSGSSLSLPHPIPLTSHGLASPSSTHVKPKSLSDPLSAKLMLNAIRRHWLALTVIGTILAGSAAALVYLFLPLPKLSASQTFVVSAKIPRIHQEAFQTDNFENYKSLQKFMLKSHQVLSAVLARTDIRDLSILQDKVDKREWLERQMDVDFKVGPEIMRLTMEGDDSEVLSTILNAVAEEYMKMLQLKESSVRNSEIQVLYSQKKVLEEQVQNLKRVQKELEIKGLPGSLNEIAGQRTQIQLNSSNASLRLSMVEPQLFKLQTKILQLESQLNRLKDPKQSAADIELELKKELRDDKQYVEDEKLRDELKARVDAFLATTEPGVRNENFEKAKNELVAVEARLKKVIDITKPLVQKKVVELKKTSLENDLEDLKNEQKTMDNMKKALEEEIVKYRTKLDDFDKAATTLGNEDIAQLKALQSTIENLNKSIQAKEIEKEADLRVSRHEKKTKIDSANEGQRRLKYTALAFAGGYAMTAIGVILLESRRRRVSSADDISFGLGMRIVGTVPEMNKSRQSLISWTKEETQASEQRFQAVLTESIDATRTMLLHEARQNGLQVIMITSAVGGEGKTSLTTHLSASLARAGHSVLVIDGDMRRPAAHLVFDIENTIGLSELLRSEITLDEVIFQTPIRNIAMLPAGRWTSQTSQFLVHGQWAAMLKELRQSYDFIIVDSPPTLPVVDASLLGQHVDGVLMSVLRDVSQMSLLYEAQQRLLKLNVRILGVVMNGSNIHQDYASPYYSKYLQPHGAVASRN